MSERELYLVYRGTTFVRHVFTALAVLSSLVTGGVRRERQANLKAGVARL